jgi:hypothetical protein
LNKFSNKAAIGVLVFLLALFSLSSAVSAANEPKVITAVFQNFDNLSQFTLNRNTLDNNPGNTGVGPIGQKVLRLTRAAAQQAGSAFFTKRVSLVNQRSFAAHFSFQISSSGGNFGIPGADGLSFIIQTVNNNVGSTGGGIGYQGISPSIAVEFDTWRNNESYAQDPNDNHIGINLNGSMISSAVATNLPGNLKSGVWYAWVNYNGDTNELEVRASQNSQSRPANPIVSYNVNLKSVLNQDEVFVGFTSSTGSGWGNHDIRSFYFDNDNTIIDTDIDTYEAAPTKVTASASPALTNQSSVVSVQVKNENDSPAINKAVTFTSSTGTIQSTATTDSNGLAQAVVTSNASGTATVKAVAVGGAYAETSVTFDLDAPVTTIQVTPDNPGISGWHTSDLSVNLTAVDQSAGVQKTEYRINDGVWQTYSAPFTLTEGSHNLVFRSVDNLGNVEPERTKLIQVDHTPPVTAASIIPAGPDGVNDWYRSTANLSLTSTDSFSGVEKTEYRINGGAWATYNQPIELLEGNYTIEYYSVDKAGNEEPIQSVPLKSDTTAPVTSVAEINPAVPNGDNNWYIGDTSVKLEASDNLSGIANTEYRLNGGQWSPYTDAIHLGEGQHAVDFRSTDNAGNVEAVQTISLKSDQTAPVTSISVNQAAPKGTGGWYTADAGVTLDAADSLSGVSRTEYRLNQGAWIPYSAPFTLTEGVYNVEYRSVDLAGNTEQIRAEVVQVDKTAPTFSISVNPSEIWPANHKMVPVTVTLNATDATSQVARMVLDSITSSESANGQGDGNTSADIAGAQYGTNDTTFELRAERSGEGSGRVYTITYTITDKAGNKSTAAITVTVPHDKSNK